MITDLQNFNVEYHDIKKCNNDFGINYNPKYKNFKQFIFTCGDKQDLKQKLLIFRKKDKLVKIIKPKTNILDAEIISLFENYPIYKNINEESFRTSLKYLFFKIKYGIYVRIKDNKLNMFVPFNNQQFKNNWHSLIKIDKDWAKYNYQKFVDINKRNPKKNEINFEKDFTKWDADNCVIDTRRYRSYKLINASYYISMFQHLCRERKISDVEFFINHRDFPVLKKDYTQPYNHLYNSDSVPLEKKYQNKHFLPITSMSKRDNFMDILLPTVDDWEIINQTIHFGMCRDQYINFDKKIEKRWSDKIPTAIFRGSTTDCGYDEKTSLRYKIHEISQLWEKDNKYNENNKIDKTKFLDVDINAGITKVWFNDIKLENKNLQYPKRLDTVDRIEFLDMSNYKYIINIDGSVTAFRLTAELNYMSVILKVESDYYIWYSKLLEPWKHYIPIKRDLSDLAEKIKWCKEHDDECYEIAKNAQKFYKKYINKEFALNYLEFVMNFIAIKTFNLVF
jgi:hypothetical protein